MFLFQISCDNYRYHLYISSVVIDFIRYRKRQGNYFLLETVTLAIVKIYNDVDNITKIMQTYQMNLTAVP